MQQLLVAGTAKPFTPVIRAYTSGTSATETAPAGCSNVVIEVWDAGGAGGTAGSSAGQGAGGGGGGGYARSSYACTGGKTIVYTIGIPSSTNSSVSSGTLSITTMNTTFPSSGSYPNIAGTGGGASGGNQANTTGNNGGAGAGSSGGAGAAGITGTISGDGSPYGAGGHGGNAPSGAGSAGSTGAVVFYYT